MRVNKPCRHGDECGMRDRCLFMHKGINSVGHGGPINPTNIGWLANNDSLSNGNGVSSYNGDTDQRLKQVNSTQGGVSINNSAWLRKDMDSKNR